LFYGIREKDFFSAEQWILRIEKARTASHWNDAQTAVFVYNALRGIALSWYEALRRSRINTDNWAEFRTAFLTAYSATRTSRTATFNLADLRQGPTESTVGYYARVVKVIDDIAAMAPPHFEAPAAPFGPEIRGLVGFAALAEAVTTTHVETLIDHGVTEAFNFVGLHVFIAGLRSNVREKIMETPPQDLYTAFESALALEKIRTEPKKAPASSAPSASVYEVEETSEAEPDSDNGLENEIAAISAKLKNLKKKRGKGGNFPAQKATPGKPPQKPSGSTFDNRCFYCKKPGHRQLSCFARIKAGAQMVDKHGKPLAQQPSVQNINGSEQMASSQQQLPQHQHQFPPPSPFYPHAYAHAQNERGGQMWESAQQAEQFLN
jgi:hypothetical protein